jgi:hypothetical protein
MVSFLIALVLIPVPCGLAWVYLSPLSSFAGNTLVKVYIRLIIRVVLFAATFVGFFVPLYYLAHHVPSNLRRIYVLVLLVIEAIPMFLIGFYRTSQLKSAGKMGGGSTVRNK